VKRRLSGCVALVALVAAGALVSACNITPTAATANGTTISVSSLNSQLHTLSTTVAGACLLQLESNSLSPSDIQGEGGSGTYTMEFATTVLDNEVGNLLAEQYAGSKGITISDADLTTAKSDFSSTLDGEISEEVETAESEGVPSFCEEASGSNITGAELLAGLPSDVASAQVRNQAVDEALLSRGADLSGAAVDNYYNSNKAQFTVDCVSMIATDTETHANQLVSQIDAGASFASVAKADSADSQTASDGGQLGCDYTQSEVEESLQLQSIPVGQPIAPIEDSSSGQWDIYEVTSQVVEPLNDVTSVVRRELLETSSNVDRVSREIVAFARRSNVSVNPQYGTWKAASVIPPASPPAKYLLPTASSASDAVAASSPSLSEGSSGSAATGSAGSSASG
jgi:hypothetical protein